MTEATPDDGPIERYQAVYAGLEAWKVWGVRKSGLWQEVAKFEGEDCMSAARQHAKELNLAIVKQR